MVIMISLLKYAAQKLNSQQSRCFPGNTTLPKWPRMYEARDDTDSRYISLAALMVLREAQHLTPVATWLCLLMIHKLQIVRLPASASSSVTTDASHSSIFSQYLNDPT